MGSGIRDSLKSAIGWVLSPLVMVNQLAILVLEPGEMTLHVTNFAAPLSYSGVSLASNWAILLLVMSAMPILALQLPRRPTAPQA